MPSSKVSPDRRATPARRSAIAGGALVLAVFAWLLIPRPAGQTYDDIAPRGTDSSYELAPGRGDSSYDWPVVRSTITTVTVIMPEDLP
jgi:hypothetical protein